MAGIIALPWCIKPVFGYSFDQIMKIIKKSKYLIVLCAFMRIFLFSIFFFYNLNIYLYYVLRFIAVIIGVYENIVCEYTLVMTTKQENKKNGNKKANHLPIFFGTRGFGCVVASLFAGKIIDSYGLNVPFFIGSLLPVFMVFCASTYFEKAH